MCPELTLRRSIDVLEHSPLVRGVHLTLNYALKHSEIGLTKSQAMNRKFVHWAADAFRWPDYAADDLFAINKVLNEHDMPPLVAVHDLILHLKLMRRYRGTLRLTKQGMEAARDPSTLFELAAPVYLYGYVHDPRAEETERLIGNWDIFLNVINMEAETGCTAIGLVRTLYGMEDEPDHYDRAYQDMRLGLLIGVLRPLCWLGVLAETRKGQSRFSDGVYNKTALWSAALRLESDRALESISLSPSKGSNVIPFKPIG